MFLALIAGLLLAASDPISSTAETAPPVVAASEDAGVKADKSRLVCKRESKPNSRFTTKICKTVEEWEERTRTAEEAFEDVRGRPMVKICSPTGGCD